jgi:hypothetical protein
MFAYKVKSKLGLCNLTSTFMSNERQNIPGLQIKRVGNRKNTIKLIEGIIQLPCWDGYYLDENPLKHRIKTVTGGQIILSVDAEITTDEKINCDREQVNTYWYLVEQQEHVKQAILQALVNDFPRLLEEEYKYFDVEEGDFPPLSDIVPGYDFKNYIGPNTISIGEEFKDDAAYVTWYFSCRWDPEHGFQVVTHNDRIIDIAQDSNPWKISKDNGTYTEEMEQRSKNAGPPPFAWKKKKWWQFWK